MSSIRASANVFEYKPNESGKIVQRVDDYSFKTSIATTSIDVRIRRRERNGTVRIKQLDEKSMSYYIGLKFPSHHYLFPSINEKIPQLYDVGLINFWNACKSRFCAIIPKVFEPNILTMNHMEKGFLIWITLLAVAFLAFLVEMLMYWTPKYLTLAWFDFVIASYYGMLSTPH